MQRVIEDRIRQDDFRFIQDIWGDWSPGYDADDDMVHIREALRDPDHLRAALGLLLGPVRPDALRLARVGRRAGGRLGRQRPAAGALPARHHRRVPRRDQGAGRAGQGLRRPGSDAELIEGVGHFMLVERPEEINKRITDWLARTS